MFEVGKKYDRVISGYHRCKCISVHTEGDQQYAWMLNFAGTPFTAEWDNRWKEHKLPITVQGWVNVYEVGPAWYFHATKQEAIDAICSPSPHIATVFVSGEEDVQASNKS